MSNGQKTLDAGDVNKLRRLIAEILPPLRGLSRLLEEWLEKLKD